MTAKKVAFVLVPGSFSPANLYHQVNAILTRKGYKVQECQLLSACPLLAQRTPPATMLDDAVYINEAVSALLERDKNVVLCMNSYGGLPGTEAAKGLSKAERPEGSAALIGLVYLGACLPTKGDSCRKLLSEILFEPLKSGVPGRYMMLPPELGPNFFSDLPSDKQQWYFSQMVCQSSDSFDGELTHEAWRNIDCTYVKCEADMIITPGLQQSMVTRALEQGGRVKVVGAQIAGHCIHVSQPEFVAKILEEAAELA